MTGRDLTNILNKHWQTYCDEDVFISIGDELVNLAEVDYDEENSRFVMIPEAKDIGAYREKNDITIERGYKNS